MVYFRPVILSLVTLTATANAQSVFQTPIPVDQLLFVNQFAGQPSGNIVRDKQFRKLMHTFVPDCVFHYGWDTPLSGAVEQVTKGSTIPVRIRDGRYVTVSGMKGPILAGRGFLWIDLHTGIALGGFYFHPTNGEPTPSVTVFSKQVKQDSLSLTQLPQAFAADLFEWSHQARIPPLTARYFITGFNRKILLEHDEDYGSMDLNAAAADLDLDAADYLEQTNHATNATAWIVNGGENSAWLQFRNQSCGAAPDPLSCRIRMTRERVRKIIRREPSARPNHT
jgi:hypothetical protein